MGENDFKKSVPHYEQETVIQFMRDEPFATIYSSDSTMITKLDKLCRNSPDMYSLIEESWAGKRYKLNDKSLISLRGKKRSLNDEQRIAAGERMKKLHEERKA